MSRRLFVVIVSLALLGAWSAGRAQTRVANFQFTIEVPRGPARVMCERGCDWPGSNEGVLLCEQERCRFAFTEQGRVRFGLDDRN
jgi:hypothetical protein